MIHRLFPLVNRTLRFARPQPPMSGYAETTEIICPEETTMMPAIRMDPEEWQFVTGVYESNPFELEQKRVNGYLAVHRATRKYRFRNVLASPTGFHVLGGSFEGSGGDYLGPLRAGSIERRARGFFASDFVKSRYFGHWLRDGLSTALLREKDEDLYLWTDPTWHHARDYLAVLNVERIAADYVFFDEMTFCEDIGMNKSRRARIRHVKEAVNATRPANSRGRRVCMRRGATGASRSLINEPELIAALEGRGFAIVDVTEPLERILDQCVGAGLTVSMEGSNGAHLLMASQVGATHITINPSDRFNNVFADYLPALGDKLCTTVALREAEGYRVNIDRVLTLVDEAS